MEGDEDLLVLRPVARMAQILGQHLIRDNIVGVLELVKNGYDADAENVVVDLRHLKDPARTEIMVLDNGTGMDEDTIRGPWSEPAHGGKQNDKNIQKRSGKGRLPLGEKGVGRFATQKLGRILEMVTRPKGSRFEFLVTIDWDDFDNSDAYLDQIRFPLERRIPEVFAGDAHGTRLLMRNSPTPWKPSNVKALQAGMMRLLSPSRENRDFAVTLRCAEYPEMEDLERGIVLEKFQFKIECQIRENGVTSYTYVHRNPDGTTETIKEPKMNVWASVNKNWQTRDPVCGPLRIILYAWLRPIANLNEYGLTREQLDELSGVSIYRDGFRIIPYGDKGDDWLRLDIRRTNQPGTKYGNNQIIGQIEITQDRNKDLIDKTSREGLWENDAYSDMRDIVLGVLGCLETASMEERGRAKKQTKLVKTLKAKITELERQVSEIKNRPKTPDVETKVAEDEAATSEPPTVSVPIDRLAGIEQSAREINLSSDEVIRESSEVAEEKREEFLHLMGMGLSAERFTHEFDRLVAGMSHNFARIEEKHPHYGWTKALRRSLDQLINEVSLISTARYVRRPPKEQVVDIRNVLKMALNAHQSIIEEYKIRVEMPQGGDFEINISLASISQVLDNVISNAFYWLNLKSEINDRRIHIAINGQDRSIIISDNARPIPRHIKNTLFNNPFVTTKPDGRGLGLYISNEILKKNNGEIDFLPDSDPRNMYGLASFIISFHQK